MAKRLQKKTAAKVCGDASLTTNRDVCCADMQKRGGECECVVFARAARVPWKIHASTEDGVLHPTFWLVVVNCSGYLCMFMQDA